LSAFADEISSNLEASLDVLAECGINTIELRAVDRVNVMDLSADQMEYIERVLNARSVSVGCIASPIGKAEITGNFETELARMEKALHLAKSLGSRYVRVFSYYLPKGEEPDKWRDKVLERIKILAREGEKAGVGVLLENEEGLYGDTVERCVDIVKAVGSSALRIVYDPCNLVIIGPRPFTDSYKTVRPHIEYLHVKDWSRDRKEMVPAGQGDAEWEPILADLVKTGYEGIIALEPHLSSAGQFSGFSGPDLFRSAYQSLSGLMKKTGMVVSTK